MNGIEQGHSWCQGVEATPKKSHPHPKGSENDWVTNVTLTMSIGTTKATQTISPIGTKAPVEDRNKSNVLDCRPANRLPAAASTSRSPGKAIRATDHNTAAKMANRPQLPLSTMST